MRELRKGGRPESKFDECKLCIFDRKRICSICDAGEFFKEQSQKPLDFGVEE